jgi:predicted metal-dependent phosphoesterase TrpH
MGKADLHIHTTYSFDASCTVSAVLDWAANETELDVIAITDHDEFGGALEARERASEFGIEVIPGLEISTSEGHLLALYLERPVAAGLSLLETVLKVGEQGGLCIAAHPHARLAHGLTGQSIRTALQDPDAAKILVGIETCNAGLWYQGSNAVARRLADELQLSPVGNSDSHLFWTIGIGCTEFAGHSAQDLRASLLSGTTSAHNLVARRPPSYFARHIVHRMLRRLGWALWAPEPNASMVWRRIREVHAPW